MILGLPSLVTCRDIYMGILKEMEGCEIKNMRLQADVFVFFLAYAHRDLVYIYA